MVEAGIPAIRMYFFGFFMMSLQFAGSPCLWAWEIQKRGIFSIFRKVIHCHTPYHHHCPLYSEWNPGHTDGRAISNFIGGRRLLRDHAAHCVA